VRGRTRRHEPSGRYCFVSGTYGAWRACIGQESCRVCGVSRKVSLLRSVLDFTDTPGCRFHAIEATTKWSIICGLKLQPPAVCQNLWYWGFWILRDEVVWKPGSSSTHHITAKSGRCFRVRWYTALRHSWTVTFTRVVAGSKSGWCPTPRHFVTWTPSSSDPGLGCVPCEAMLCNDDHHMSGYDGESRKKGDVRGEILPCWRWSGA
jgi:hypothetical protein